MGNRPQDTLLCVDWTADQTALTIHDSMCGLEYRSYTPQTFAATIIRHYHCAVFLGIEKLQIEKKEIHTRKAKIMQRRSKILYS